MSTLTKITVLVELEIENNLINDDSALESDLVGEFVKVKSGTYENIGIGHIIQVLP